MKIYIEDNDSCLKHSTFETNTFRYEIVSDKDNNNMHTFFIKNRNRKWE
jgi:hypothetical protein